jgi:nitrate/TMAO reductase-like tetraheme cytochrome c subunit
MKFVGRGWPTCVAAAAIGVSLLPVALVFGGCGTTPGWTRLKPITEKPKPYHQTVFLASSACQTCHPKQYEEWRTSMHAYAQHSPVFQAFNAYVLKASGGTVGTFCDRCHSPIGISSGESPILPDNKRSEVALDGVGCMTCHSQHTNQVEASGLIPVPIPGDAEPVVYGPYYGSDEANPTGDPLNQLIKTPHKSAYSKYFGSANLCGACHDVLTPDGFRIEEAYSEWKNGPYARKGIICQDCHMGPEPGKHYVRAEMTLDYIVDHNIFPQAPKRYRTNHRFTGPDYSMLPEFGKNALGLDRKSFGRLEQHLEQERETLLRNAATVDVRAPSSVAPGSTMRIGVSVTNSGAGHNFPTGFASERQVWLEVIVSDSARRPIYSSGDLDRNADLRDWESDEVQNGSLPVDWDLTNFEAAFVLTNFRGTQSNGVSTTNRLINPIPFVTPATEPAFIQGFPFAGRIFKQGIPPLQTRTANYDVKVPADAAGPLLVSVKLRYRNFPPHFLRDIGVADLVEKLRTVDLTSYSAEVAVSR